MAVQTQAEKKYQTLAEFWPFYVLEHRQPLTRWLHFIGTTTLFIWLLVALIRRNPKLLVGAVVSPYAWAWAGHFLVEKNRPATFKYPVKSLVSDFIMYGKMWRGKMEAEVARYAGE
jgi:hypothetical protein